MSSKTNSVASSRKTVAQVKKELIKKINAKVGKKEIKLEPDDQIMAQYVSQYAFEQIVCVGKNKVATDDADGEENELELIELNVDVLIDLCDALKIK
jgi:hypothetical protein